MTLDPITVRTLTQMCEITIARAGMWLPLIAIVAAIVAAVAGEAGPFIAFVLLGAAVAVLVSAAAGSVLVSVARLVEDEKAAADAICNRDDPDDLRKLLFATQMVAFVLWLADFWWFNLPYHGGMIFFVIAAGIGVYQRWTAEQRAHVSSDQRTPGSLPTAQRKSRGQQRLPQQKRFGTAGKHTFGRRAG